MGTRYYVISQTLWGIFLCTHFLSEAVPGFPTSKLTLVFKARNIDTRCRKIHCHLSTLRQRQEDYCKLKASLEYTVERHNNRNKAINPNQHRPGEIAQLLRTLAAVAGSDFIHL